MMDLKVKIQFYQSIVLVSNSLVCSIKTVCLKTNKLLYGIY